MIENKIKLNIITNRKLCENENLEKQIEKIYWNNYGSTGNIFWT